jgi:hypothetical protein
VSSARKPRAQFKEATNGRRSAVLWAIGAAAAHDMASAPRGLTSSERLVLYTVERFVGFEQRNTGECWPSVPALALAADLGERTVYRALRALEAKGWLSVRRRTIDGERVTSVYRVTPPAAPADEPADELH